MKMTILALALFTSLTASATSGRVKLANDPNLDNASVVEITGKAAQELFDKLSDESMVSIDASESPDGQRRIFKNGQFYMCIAIFGKANATTCTLSITDNVKGILSPFQD